MKKLYLLVMLLPFLGGLAHAKCPQMGPPYVFSPLNANNTWCGNNVFTIGTFDASLAPYTKPFTVGLNAAKPLTCPDGAAYFASDLAPGTQLHLCKSNTWTQVSGGGGGGGTPGGTPGQLQYNSAGSFGGMANTAFAGSTLTLTSPFVLDVSAATLKVLPSTTLNNLASWDGSGHLLDSGLTKSGLVNAVTNDTNITGSISTNNLTLGWTGTLAAARLNSNVVQTVANDTNINGAISGQQLAFSWAGTLAAARLNTNVVQAFTNDTNITASVSAQNATLAWAGTLGVTRGGLNLSAIAANQIPLGTASNVYTAKTLPDCNGSSNALNYTQSTFAFSCLSIATLTNPMSTLGDVIYGGAAGAVTRLAAPTTPATTFYLVETPSGGLATAETWSKGGLPGRNVTGGSDTILGSDNAKTVTYCNPAPPSATACTTATAVAVTIGDPNTNCGTSSDLCQNFVTSIVSGAGLVTLTPATKKINGQASWTMRNEVCRLHTNDTVAGDWLIDCPPNNNVRGVNADTGASNAYVTTCTNVPPVVNGSTCYFSPTNANTTVSTINVSGMGVGPLTRVGGGALLSGDLLASPASYEIRYDGTRWTVPSPSGNTSGIVSGTQNTFGVYSDSTHVSSGVNPLASVFFSNADRGQAMHDCQLANTNGVLGDWCDARGEVATAIPVHTNMFPRLSDFGGTTGNQGGGVNLPSGGITIDAGQYIYGNNLTVVGNGVGAGTAGKGPSSFLPSGSFAVGSGGTFNEFMFNFGLPSYGLSTNGFPGPYSTKVNGGFQVNCNNTADLAGIGIFSGQDGTSQSDFGVSNCVIANLIGGSHATSNGISLEHGYMTRGAATSCIAGTTASGGVLWNVPSTGWQISSAGLVIMDQPTGGSGGNASNANLKPGVEIIVGAYTDTGGALTAHGTNVTAGSSHSTLINGVYRVGSVADVATVTNVVWTADAVVTGVGTAVVTAANDFGPDINAQTNNAPCTLAHLQSNVVNPFTDTNTCIWNSLVYFNGLTGNGAFLNGKTGIVLAASAGSFTAAVTSAQGSQSGVSAGTAASANAIDSWTQNLTHTGGNPSAVPFTKVGQIAWLENAPGAADQCTGVCNPVGTITPFSGGIEIDTPSGGREIGFITEVASGCKAATSEFPLHEFSLDGKFTPWLHDNHVEESYGAGIAVGENAATQGVRITRNTPVTHIGYINNNGGAVAASFEPAGIKLSSNYGAVMNATLEDNACIGGQNNPTYCIMDQFNLNNIASATDPVSNYWADGSGVVGGVFTNASPGTMTNGIDIYGGVLSGIYSGVQAQKIDSTGVNLMASALSSEATTAGTYTAGKAACVTATDTVGNCASVVASAGLIGILMAKDGTLPRYATQGTVSVNSVGSSTFTAGDFVCVDPSNAAVFVDNGSTACTTRQVGIVKTTNTGTSHTVALTLGGSAGGGSGSGTVNSGTAAQVAYYPASAAAVSGNPNLTITNGALTVGAAAAGASVQLFGNTSGSATIGVTATGGTLQLPSGTTATSAVLTTPAIGAATGTSLAASGGLSGQTVNLCADTSGSGTAQVCTTAPATFTVVADSCFTYTTTTTNSGTGLTVNANSLGAKSVAIPGGSGWTTTLGINIIPANKPILLCYDGTNMNVQQTGTAATGLGSQAINTVAVGPVDTPGGGSATATFVAAPSPLYFQDPRNWIYFNEEWLNTGGGGQYGWNSGGTGGTVTEQATAGTYGAVRCAVAATTNDECFQNQNGGGAGFWWDFHLTTQADIIMRGKISATTTLKWFSGYVNVNSGHGEGTADYFGFAYDTSAGDTNFMCVHKNSNGTPATLRTSTGVAADTSYHRFRVRFTSAGHFSCSVDDGTETAMAPTTFTNSTLAPQMDLVTLANTAINMEQDYYFAAIKAAR